MILERMHISIVATNNALLGAKCPDVNQNSMADFYADMLRAEAITKKPCDWSAVNKAILERWPKGLVRIKDKAWRKIHKRE